MSELVEMAKRALAEKKGLGTTPRPTHHDWLQAWRHLARDTYGVTPDDPRLQPVFFALSVCDDLFLRGDWDGFQQAVQKVRRAMQNGK